ncbi:MAG: tetratricopeptide repeat protein [Planctomycetota bacterium]
METQDARRLVQAEGYLELDLPEEAQKCLAAVNETTKRSFEWNLLAAETHRVRKEYADALALFEAAHRQRPQDITIYVNLGWCLKRLHRLKDAITVLKKADEICTLLNKENEHALIKYNLSCYFSLLLEKEPMLDYLRQALEKDSSYVALIAKESDFDPFRDDPDFLRLIGSVEFPA